MHATLNDDEEPYDESCQAFISSYTPHDSTSIFKEGNIIESSSAHKLDNDSDEETEELDNNL